MKHRIYDHKVLAIFATIALFTALLVIPTLALAYAGIDTRTATGRVIMAICTIAIALFMQLVVFERQVRGEAGSALTWSTAGLLMALPMLGLAACNFIGFTPSDLDKMNPIPLALLLAASPSISEEIVFRGIPTSNWMRLACDTRSIVWSTAITSLVFGATHGLNSIAGEPLSTAAFQMFYAVCGAIVFNAVFLRSGSIVPAIIVHTITDFTAFLFLDLQSGGVLTQELTLSFAFWVTLAVSIVMLCWGIYLLRPSKHGEIVALWHEKCHKE